MEQVDKGTACSCLVLVSASQLTKRYTLVEAHVLERTMYRGKHMDTETQRCMFHFGG